MEVEAVFRVLLAHGRMLINSQVCVLTDNMAILSVWQNQGARNGALNKITKRIFHLTLKENCEIQVQLCFLRRECGRCSLPLY